MFKAIVIGGTGATGHQLIKQLIENDNCEKITSIGRKPVLNGQEHNKLSDIVLDSLFDLSSTKDYWQGNDCFFNCIGTTRRLAGGPQEFINIEAGISKEPAKMASKANIAHASLISAAGANHKRWAVEWIHPLLYIKTMGQKEQTIVSDFHFKYVSIFKPGMLVRLQDKEPWFEKIFKKTGFGLRVDSLASAMIKDAEKVANGLVSEELKYFIGNNDIISSKSN